MAKRWKTGVVGIFTDSDKLKAAAEKVKQTNVRDFDAFTPFPVHGLEDSMGIPRSKLPWISLFGGLTGFAIALSLQTYVAVISWPLNVGGKPFFSFPAFIPVMFELTVLLSGLSTAAGLFLLCGMPNMNPQVFDPAITDNKFALFVSSSDSNYSESKFMEIMKNSGAEEVRVVK